MCYLLVEVPRRVGILYDRHEQISLQPSDVHLFAGRFVVVPVSADHIRQHERISDHVQMNQGRDQRRQSQSVSPPGLSVHHSQETTEFLTPPGRSVLDAVAESRNGFEIRVHYVVRVISQIVVVKNWKLGAPAKENRIEFRVCYETFDVCRDTWQLNV